MKTKEEVIATLKVFDAKVLHTGSRAICDIVPDTSDDDYVVLLPSCSIRRMFISLFLKSEDFEYQSSDEQSSGDSQSILFKRREDNVNLIIVHDPDHFERWDLATRTAKNMGLCASRQDRVDYFHKSLYPIDEEEIPF